MKRFGMCEGKKRVAYRCEPGTCQACRLNKKCTPYGNPRSVTRFVDQRLIEEARERIENPLGRELMRQRKTRIEGIFALGKELHGLRRTRLMGRWKVQIQLWLTATVMNLKRAIKALTNRSDGAEPSSNGGSSSSPIAIHDRNPASCHHNGQLTTSATVPDIVSTRILFGTVGKQEMRKHE